MKAPMTIPGAHPLGPPVSMNLIRAAGVAQRWGLAMFRAMPSHGCMPKNGAMMPEVSETLQIARFSMEKRSALKTL
jgi:hypothetical protein